MAVTSEAPIEGNSTDTFPLLVERTECREGSEHVIDMERSSTASSSGSSDDGSPQCLNAPQHEDRPSTSGLLPITRSSSSASDRSNSRSPTFPRRGEGRDRRWSPFNTTLWISVELVFTLGQIIAALVVLSLSTHETPQTPLFAWVVGYAAGCIASLPLLYWRYIHRNQNHQDRSQNDQGSGRIGSTPEPNSYITLSLAQATDEGGDHNASTGTWYGQDARNFNRRLNALVDHFKMALDCFFAVWFVVGNVWIFGGHTSSADAPNLYRLCIVFLTFSCIGYALPFILCAMICCCLPCIISFLGVRADMNGKRGASEECINALPTHKFKLKRTGSGGSRDSGCSELDEGGFLASGTEKERAISGEDAACCICLARYADNDELRELPCSHFFHTACVDKWLKINASCPLCKYEIVDTAVDDSLPPVDPTPETGEH